MKEGDRVSMVCQAQGYPEPRLEFFKDGKKIRSNENHIIGRTDSILIVHCVPTIESICT